MQLSAVAAVTPLEPCHECQAKALCVAVPLVRYSSGWECSACRSTRWSGVTHASGPRVLGLLCAGGVRICWRCRDSNTPPGKDTPEIEYVRGPIAFIYSQSNYKNDYHCDECGGLISSTR